MSSGSRRVRASKGSQQGRASKGSQHRDLPLGGLEVWAGFDPGPKRSGWAVITPYPKPVFLRGGLVASDSLALLKLLLAWGPSKISLELPGTYIAGYAKYQISQTSLTGGVILGLACALEIPIVTFTATSENSWRERVCGDRRSGDAAVRAALDKQIAGLPPRSSVHVRDATGVALAAR